MSKSALAIIMFIIAKLESTTFAIIQLLHEFKENYHINVQEYTSLLNSIVRFSNFASQVKDA
jgi:hypothetical protein